MYIGNILDFQCTYYYILFVVINFTFLLWFHQSINQSTLSICFIIIISSSGGANILFYFSQQRRLVHVIGVINIFKCIYILFIILIYECIYFLPQKLSVVPLTRHFQSFTFKGHLTRATAIEMEITFLQVYNLIPWRASLETLSMIPNPGCSWSIAESLLTLTFMMEQLKTSHLLLWHSLQSFSSQLFSMYSVIFSPYERWLLGNFSMCIFQTRTNHNLYQ